MRILWAEASHMSIVAGMGPAAGEAAPAIQDRLNDPNEGVRKIAAEALNAVTETGTP
jgi:HEAT repeat protein